MNKKILICCLAAATLAAGTIFTSAAEPSNSVLPVAEASQSISGKSIVMGNGETCTLTQLLPSDIKLSDVSIYNHGPSVVSVNSKSNTINALKVGSSRIAFVSNSSGKKFYLNVFVKREPSKVVLNKYAITLGINEQFDINSCFGNGEGAYQKAYISSNASAVYVDKVSGLITAKKSGTARITLTAYNGKSATCDVTVKNAPTEISLNKTKLTLGVGETFDLNSSLKNGEGAYRIYYTSSNSAVASAAKSGGLVTAKKPGTAIITAETYNGKTVTCTVTVKNAPTEISLNKTKLTLGVGETFDLNSSLKNGEGAYRIYYTSSNSDVASAAKSGGLVTAKKPGTAIITAETYNGKTVACTVTVKNAPTEISLNKTELTLGVGETFDLNSSLKSGEGAYRIYYTSSNSAIASAAKSGGLVTAKKPGTAIITAEAYNGKTVTCTVTVKNAPKSITLNHSDVKLYMQDNIKLSHSFNSGEYGGITYTSSNNSIATVSSDGTITPIRRGTATITAKTYNGKTAKCTVRVRIVNAYKAYTPTQVYNDVRNLEKSYPDIIKTSSIGKSVKGKDITLVKLGKGSKKACIVGGMHSREHITVSFTMLSIEEYAAAYANNLNYGGYNIRELLDEYTLYIVPMCNPDGTAIATTSEVPQVPYQNFSHDSFKGNSNGVNLNRNFPFYWSSVSGVSTPGKESYKGSSAASEPETKALVNLCKNNSFQWMLSMHILGGGIYWSDSANGTVPGDYALASNLSKKCGYALFPNTTSVYEYGGGFENWFRSYANRPGFCIEMIPYSQYNLSESYIGYNKYFDQAIDWSKTRYTFAEAMRTL